jgi:hypothetical protein
MQSSPTPNDPKGGYGGSARIKPDDQGVSWLFVVFVEGTAALLLASSVVKGYLSQAGKETAERIGYAMGSLILTLIVVGVFWLFRSMRKRKILSTVVLGMSGLMALLLFTLAPPSAGRAAVRAGLHARLRSERQKSWWTRGRQGRRALPLHVREAAQRGPPDTRLSS